MRPCLGCSPTIPPPPFSPAARLFDAAAIPCAHDLRRVLFTAMLPCLPEQLQGACEQPAAGEDRPQCSQLSEGFPNALQRGQEQPTPTAGAYIVRLSHPCPRAALPPLPPLRSSHHECGRLFHRCAHCGCDVPFFVVWSQSLRALNGCEKTLNAVWKRAARKRPSSSPTAAEAAAPTDSSRPAPPPPHPAMQGAPMQRCCCPARGLPPPPPPPPPSPMPPVLVLRDAVLSPGYCHA
eukprot:COSAG01_NODE_8361_length_2817_cov_1.478661_1_plen_236_part_00